MAKVLLLSLKPDKSAALGEMLEALRHDCLQAESVDEVPQRQLAALNLIILDVNSSSPSPSAVEQFLALKEIVGSICPIVLVSAESKSQELIETMRLGAFDHLLKPFTQAELQEIIERAALACVDQPAKNVLTTDFFVGLSPVMRKVEKLIGLAAGCDVTTLVFGETGTGKSTVARTIHRHWRGGREPLTVIDCTALSQHEDVFSCFAAARGTFLLDEVGDLSAPMQARLVRSLNELLDNTANQAFRIIATSQYDLPARIGEKLFREDLFYRLNVLAVTLPPLRERGSDIAALAETFLAAARPEKPKSLSKAALKSLYDYSWPGNVRELQNLMYHVTFAVPAQIIEPNDWTGLCTAAGAAQIEEDSLDYQTSMLKLEYKLLKRALQESSGSRSEAARLLGVNRQFLYAKLKIHGLM